MNPAFTRKSFETPQSLCVDCFAPLNAATYVLDSEGDSHDSHAPVPGAVTLCINCGALMIFTDRLMLRKPTMFELEQFRRNKKFWRWLMAAQAMVSLRIK